MSWGAGGGRPLSGGHWSCIRDAANVSSGHRGAAALRINAPRMALCGDNSLPPRGSQGEERGAPQPATAPPSPIAPSGYK